MYRHTILAFVLALPLAACGTSTVGNSGSPDNPAFNEALYANLDATNDSASTDGSSPMEAMKNRAELDVRETLKDPAAAQFKGLVAAVEGKCVMGQVLSKNGFGAFTGFQSFVWTDGSVAVQESDPQRWMKAQGDCIAAIGAEAKKYVDEQRSNGVREAP